MVEYALFGSVINNYWTIVNDIINHNYKTRMFRSNHFQTQKHTYLTKQRTRGTVKIDKETTNEI